MSSKSPKLSVNPALPPQFMPMNGVNIQSADAFAGLQKERQLSLVALSRAAGVDAAVSLLSRLPLKRGWRTHIAAPLFPRLLARGVPWDARWYKYHAQIEQAESLLSIVRTQAELGRAIRRGRQLEAANQALQADGRSPILAESAAMRPVLEMIAAPVDRDGEVHFFLLCDDNTGVVRDRAPTDGRPVVEPIARRMAAFDMTVLGHDPYATAETADQHGIKLVALDETHFLGEWSAGRALFTRLGRDSRKWNTCVLAASQNPADVLGMDVANFMAAAFVGFLVWLWSRYWRKWPAYILGTPVFLVVLFVFFENFARLLPANV